MKFHEVMDHNVNINRKIARKAWSTGTTILTSTDYRYTRRDILADDWYIIEDKSVVVSLEERIEALETRISVLESRNSITVTNVPNWVNLPYIIPAGTNVTNETITSTWTSNDLGIVGISTG